MGTSGWRWRVVAAVLGVGLSAAAATTVAPVGGGNALTVPAQRHLVRVPRAGQGAAYLAAVQQGGAGGHTLGLFRSNDGGSSWHLEGSVAGASREDRADLLAVGDDVALLSSYESPASSGIGGSSSRDVVFQWWRYHASVDRWRPERQARVFDSRSGRTAYYRAQLARDSRGRLWAQAFRREADGSSTLVLSVSTDGGSTWREQPELARDLDARGGGRLIASGGRLLMVWGTHGCCDAARYRVREDGAPLSAWSPTRTAIPEGLYHGAALSAVADGRGGVHLVYKDHGERLRYRRFDGHRWSSPLLLEAQGDWALQPATTRVGDTLVVFYNRPWDNGRGYDLVVRRLRGGRLVGRTVLGATSGFAGYPAGVDVMPAGVMLPFLVGLEPSSGGKRVAAVRVSSGSSSGSSRQALSASADTPGSDAESEEESEEETVQPPFEALDGVSGPGGTGGAGLSAAASGAEATAPGCGGGEGLALAVGCSLLTLSLRRRGGASGAHLPATAG